MSETQHTPSPWYYDKSTAWGWAVRSRTAKRRRWDGEQDDRYVASHVSQADACLIAAAPDMLAALEAARDTMSAECQTEGCTCGDGWYHEDPKIIAQIDAAIAKARGQG